MKNQPSPEFLSHSSDETIEYGKKLGESFIGGEILFLTGDLGSGKTCLTKGIALGLGIDDVVTSPSFTLMNIYEGRSLTLYHIDLYRLNSQDDYFDLDVDEYISPNSVVIMEWGDKFINNIPYSYLLIKIDILNDSNRKIAFSKMEIN